MRHEIEHRYRHAADEQRGDLASHQGNGESLENGVGENDRRAHDHGQRGQEHRTEAHRPRINHGFREEASFCTWLLRVATRAALKVIRKRKGLPTVSLDASTGPQEGYDTVPHPEYIADWRESPEQLVGRNETGRLIDEALSELDEKHRAIFLLRDVEGLSVKETADALGLSEANVKVRRLRARLQLRERLTREFGDPARRFEPHRHMEAT